MGGQLRLAPLKHAMAQSLKESATAAADLLREGVSSRGGVERLASLMDIGEQPKIEYRGLV